MACGRDEVVVCVWEDCIVWLVVGTRWWFVCFGGLRWTEVWYGVTSCRWVRVLKGRRAFVFNS